MTKKQAVAAGSDAAAAFGAAIKKVCASLFSYKRAVRE